MDLSALSKATARGVALSLVLNVVWEIAHLPLYTLWATGTPGGLIYAVTHCTLGDGLIAGSAYVLTAVVLGDEHWPHRASWRGILLATLFGLGYTAFSEYRSVYLVNNWAYSALMPTVFGLGVSPLLQRLLLPSISLALCRRLWLSLRH